MYKHNVAANSVKRETSKVEAAPLAAILFQPQFDFVPDFSGRNLVPVLRSWCQNCYYESEGKTGERQEAGMGGNGSRESADQSGISWEIQKTFFIRQICKIFPKSSASDFGSVFCQHTFWQLKPLTRTKQTNQRRGFLVIDYQMFR